MPTNTLNDAKCRSAKAGEKPIKLFDGGGLYLYVSTTGAKTWRLAYRIAGKPQTMSFGPYPALSLAAAREKREETKAQLRAGDDPMAPRRASRKGMTLAEANSEFWAGRNDLSASYVKKALRGIEMHLLPQLGRSNIAAITRDDLLQELRKIDAAGKYNYVRKIRIWASQIFDWAVENGYATINPAALIKPEKAFGKGAKEHFSALELCDVPDLIQRLDIEGELSSVLACRLLAYTWVRTNELRNMQWDEIDDEGRLWRIPAGKMKRRKDHLVPLSSQAMEVLQKMRDRDRGGPFVFTAEHCLDRPISDSTILMLLYRIGYKGRMTGHGWRSVASTWANENGYSPDAIERQLSHTPNDKVRSAYNRAEYLPERREMIQAWADWLDQARITQQKVLV